MRGEHRRWLPIFAALTASATYDGEDDEGGTEAIAARTACGDVIDIASLPSSIGMLRRQMKPDSLAGDCEALMGVALCRQRIGWQHEDGARGTLPLAATDRTMTLTHEKKPAPAAAEG